MTYEKEADELAMAGHLQQQLNDGGVAAARAALAPQTDKRFDGKHCVEEDCGVELPHMRLVYGRIRCTTCQCRVEDLAKRRRR